MVDLSLLEQYGRVAVRCDSEEEAIQFMKAMWDQHPEKVRNIWNPGSTNWGTRGRSNSIYYVPRIFHSVKPGESSFCQSSSLDWVERHDYQVVPFNALTSRLDLGEILSVNFDIESLFGMG